VVALMGAGRLTCAARRSATDPRPAAAAYLFRLVAGAKERDTRPIPFRSC